MASSPLSVVAAAKLVSQECHKKTKKKPLPYRSWPLAIRRPAQVRPVRWKTCKTNTKTNPEPTSPRDRSDEEVKLTGENNNIIKLICQFCRASPCRVDGHRFATVDNDAAHDTASLSSYNTTVLSPPLKSFTIVVEAGKTPVWDESNIDGSRSTIFHRDFVGNAYRYYPK